MVSPHSYRTPLSRKLFAAGPCWEREVSSQRHNTGYNNCPPGQAPSSEADHQHKSDFFGSFLLVFVLGFECFVLFLKRETEHEAGWIERKIWEEWADREEYDNRYIYIYILTSQRIKKIFKEKRVEIPLGTGRNHKTQTPDDLCKFCLVSVCFVCGAMYQTRGLTHK